MITLRKLRPEDKETLLYWRNLPEVASQMFNEHEISAEEHDRWFAAIPNNVSRRYWIIVYQGKDVGLANLYDINRTHRRCYGAWYLGDPHMHGAGIGAWVEYLLLEQVFKTLDLHKYCCEILADNQRVIDFHKKLGFSEEGRWREHIHKKGTFVDVVALAILRSEWEDQKPKLRKLLKHIDECTVEEVCPVA